MRYSIIKNIILFILLLVLSYTNAFLFIEESWSLVTYSILFTLCLSILLLVKLEIKYLIYISISLLPCLNYFIPLGFFSITLPELFIAITVMLYILNHNIRMNKYVLFYLILLFLCILSLIGSPVSTLILGTFLRFVFVVFFIIVLYSTSINAINLNYIITGIYTIPFVAISAYIGEGFFLHLILTNFLSFQRVIYSFQYPIWLSLILPLLIFFKLNKKIILFYFGFSVYIILLSYARSIYIGFFIALIFFIFFHKSKFSLIIKKSFTFLCLVGLIIIYSLISIYLSRFSFSSEDNGSNVARFEKFKTAYIYILKHPILGNGFGINYALDISNQRLSNDLMNDLISPEFGPLTLLAEIGILGSILYYILFFYFFKYSIKILSNQNAEEYFKFLIYIFIIAEVSIFLNSNSYTNMVLLTFMPMPYLINKNILSKRL